jgi:glucose-1-phosphatase
VDSTSIRVILYDLGNVILPFKHFQIAEKLARFSGEKEYHEPQTIFSYLFDFEKGAINGYEKGKMSSSEFFQSLKETFGLSLSYEEFIPIWVDIFTENQEVSELILSQKGKWRLGLLSNTNPLHFDYIYGKYPIVRVFDRWILSHEVGSKKPEVEIFQRAMEWAAVEPGEILFIDDMKQHIDVAVSLGMKGIHFLSASQLKKELSTQLNPAIPAIKKN